MRILVTGISGLLGWNIAEALSKRKDLEVFGSFRSHAALPGIAARELDLENARSIRDLVEWSRPDAVIHAAAMSRADACERDPEAALRINSDAVRLLAEALVPFRARLVYCSTDLVFDGLNAPYAEDAQPAPCHAYGRTKAAGEREALAYEAGCVARMALMFGDGPAASPSFLGWLDKGLRSEEGVTVFSDEIRTALYVPDAVEGLLRIALSHTTGLYHLGGPEAMSRADFARLYARIFGLDGARAHAVSQADSRAAGPRPPNVSLNIKKARKELGFSPMGMEEALLDLKRRRERKGQ